MMKRFLSIMNKTLLMLALVTLLVSNPLQLKPAYADDTPPPSNVQDCAADSGFKDSQITSQIVYCVKTTIIKVTEKMMFAVSDYMVTTTTVAFAVAVALFGMRLVGGEAEVTSKTIGLLSRLALVFLYGYALGFPNNTDLLFRLMDWLVDLVGPSPGWSPWEVIDAFVGRLFGFGGDKRTMVNGVAGVIFAAALSASTGTAIFSSAVMAFFSLMLFVLDIVYAYLTAVLVLSFTIIISPMIIPLALFAATDRYFKKWCQIMIGAIIMPMLLFGFLSHVLGVFDVLIKQCTDTLSAGIIDKNGNPVYDKFFKVNEPVFSWLASADPNKVDELGKSVETYTKTLPADEKKNISPDTKKVFPPIATEINPFDRVAMDISLANFPGVDYDADTIKEIIFTFITLWIYCKLLQGIIRKIPEIAQQISAGVRISISPQNFKDRIAMARKDGGVGIGAITGGFLGGKIGGAASSNSFGGRSAGTVAGMLLGGSAGEKVSVSITNQVAEQINNALIGRR